MKRENRPLFNNNRKPNLKTGAPGWKHPGNPFWHQKRRNAVTLSGSSLPIWSPNTITVLSGDEDSPAPRQKEAESNVSWWRGACHYFQWPGKQESAGKQLGKRTLLRHWKNGETGHLWLGLLGDPNSPVMYSGRLGSYMRYVRSKYLKIQNIDLN